MEITNEVLSLFFYSYLQTDHCTISADFIARKNHLKTTLLRAILV